MPISSLNMKVILLLLLAIFCMVVDSCPPPFNDFRYVENSTLLDEFLSSQLDAPLDSQLAGAHVITGGRSITIWPRTGAEGVTIPYCYKDRWTRNRVSEEWNAGWNLWLQKIGPAGPAFGHRLNGFREVTFNHVEIFCYLPDTTWNPRVPTDAVQINIIPGGFRAEATLGYIPVQYAGNIPRHKMNIAYDKTMDLANRAFLVAHEMGHIFGLAHEHQRPDRDHYVHFDYTKLPNYAAVAAHLQQNPRPGLDLQTLCTSSLWPRTAEYSALGWGPAADYSLAPWWDQYHRDANGNFDGHLDPITAQAHGPYDYQSIMHYASTTSMPVGGVKTVDNVALVAWKQYQAQPPNQVNDQNAQLIGKTSALPSDGDFRTIQFLYPWP